MLAKLYKYIFILSIGVFLISCVNLQSSKSDVITLRISTWASESESPQEREILNAYEKLHPRIKIKNVYAPWGQYTEKVVTLSVGRIAPDLIWLITSDLPSYASRNILTDLTEQVAKDRSIDTSLYFPHALDICSYKSRLYALPRDVCCWFYVYNKDMFDEAGVPYPSTDWTWDDFLDICKKLTKDKNGDGRIDQYGTLDWYYNDIVHQNGGATFSPDGRENWTTKPEFVEAIQWWTDLGIKHHVAPLPSERTGFMGDILFQNGMCALSRAGPWVFATYKRNIKFNFDIVNLPHGKVGSKACLLGLPIAISNQTKHHQEAYNLLKFLTYSKEAQTLQAKLGVATPSRKDLALSDVFAGQEIMPDHINLYLKSMLESTYPPYMYTYTRAVEEQLTSAMDLSNMGILTAKEALESKKPIIDKIIRKALTVEQRKEEIKK